MNRYSNTERIGVNAIERIIIDDFGWIFREQPIVDMGIDAHIEYVEDTNPSGKLIAVQIKAGESHFKKGKNGYIYYGKNAHLTYWVNHSLPVILIGYLPESKSAIWINIDRNKIEKTEKNWKITIPYENLLDKNSITTIHSLFKGSPAQQELRRFAIDKPLMRAILEGKRVSVRLEEWVNKSLGRTPVQVFIYNEDGEEELSQEWFQYHFIRDPKALTEKLFPWADASLDRDFYDEQSYLCDEDDWQNTYHSNRDDEEIFPYDAGNGEVEFYQLQLTLNDIGEAYLTLSSYLQNLSDKSNILWERE